jgi:integrase
MRIKEANFVSVNGQPITGLYQDVDKLSGKVRAYYYLLNGKKISCTSDLTTALQRFFTRQRNNNLTWQEILSIYLTKELNQTYRHDCIVWLNEFEKIVNKSKVSETTFDDISSYSAAINLQSQSKARPDLYINHRFAALRVMFAYAANKFENREPIELILTYMRQLDYKKQRKPNPKIATKEQVKTLYKADDLTKLLLCLGLNCALPWADIKDLKWEHLNLKEKTLQKRRHKTDIVIATVLWDATVKLLEQLPRDTEFVFTQSITYLRRYWSSVNGTLGTNVRHKFLRASCRTVATMGNVNSDLIKIVMGHANGISDHYTAKLPSMTKPVTDAVRKYYFGKETACKARKKGKKS